MELFLNKKGMGLETIVKAIPVILMAGILFFVVVQYIEFGSHSVDREACKDSVLLKEKSKTLGRPLIGDVNCKTNTIEIKETDLQDVNAEIAGEMYDCWKQFGEGNVDFLSDRDFGRGDNWCFVCSRIDFSEDTQKKVPQIEGFFDYLKTEPIPLDSENRDFFTYIYGGFSEGIDPQNFEFTYSTKDPLYIVYFADKRFELVSTEGKDIITIAADLLGPAWTAARVGLFRGIKAGVWGAVIGTATGLTLHYTGTKTKFVSGIYIGAPEELIERCGQ